MRDYAVVVAFKSEFIVVNMVGIGVSFHSLPYAAWPPKALRVTTSTCASAYETVRALRFLLDILAATGSEMPLAFTAKYPDLEQSDYGSDGRRAKWRNC